MNYLIWYIVLGVLIVAIFYKAAKILAPQEIRIIYEDHLVAGFVAGVGCIILWPMCLAFIVWGKA